MDKKEIINEIMDVYDENARLNQENIALRSMNHAQIKAEREEEEKNSINWQITNYIALEGQKKIIGYSSLFEFYNAKVFDEEKNEFVPLSTWLSLVEVNDYVVGNLPKDIKDNLPRKELKKVFFLYLQEEFRKRVDNKKAELLEEGEPKKEEEGTKE